MSVTEPESSKSEILFIKGYKVDLEKIQNTYGLSREDPRIGNFLALWEKFPLPFKHLGTGDEPDGHIALVMVFEEGYDRENLERKEIPCLGPPFDIVFTPGIWVNH